jgi:hypothetical protein
MTLTLMSRVKVENYLSLVTLVLQAMPIKYSSCLHYIFALMLELLSRIFIIIELP